MDLEMLHVFLDVLERYPWSCMNRYACRVQTYSWFLNQVLVLNKRLYILGKCKLSRKFLLVEILIEVLLWS